MKNDVLYSSGATYSMLQRFEDKENWDDNLNHIWKNLNQHYKDYFSDDLSAKANLYLLSNMQNIQNALKEVREKKDEIIRKRKEEFIKAIENDDYEHLLNSFKIKEGDFFYIPSGTLHAICSGSLIYEAQQSSDISTDSVDPSTLNLAAKYGDIEREQEAYEEMP